MSDGPDRAAARARLSHDLKNPLSVIIGYGELLATRADEASRIEASQMIVAAAERLSREIDEALELLLPD